MEISVQNDQVPVKIDEDIFTKEKEDFIATSAMLEKDENQGFCQEIGYLTEQKKKKLYTCFYCEFSVEKFKYIKSHIKRFHVTDSISSNIENPIQVQFDLEPNVPPPIKEIKEMPSASVPVPEPITNPVSSQTKKFDMDLCPYCDFSDKNEKKLRHHILSKHSKELDKIIIYNYESDKTEPKNPSKRIENPPHENKNNKVEGTLPMSFKNSNKSVTSSQRKKTVPAIKQETSDRNQNDIIPFTMQPDIGAISLNKFNSAKDVNNFKCPSCNYVTSEAWELMFHVTQSHPEGIQSQHSIFSNRRGIHEEIEEYDETKMAGKIYYCVHCKYSTHRAQLLNRHLLSKHSDRKPHRCHACDYATKRMEHLNRHILSKHSGEKPFPCQYCDYRASRDDHLRNHVLSKHAGEQLLRCVHCGYSALSTEHLNIHVLTKHSDQKPFMCQLCDFAGGQEEDLTKHMMNEHAESEPFRCEHCPYSSSRLEQLNKHLLEVHAAERPYRCKLCDYSSARSEHLNYHLMSKHRDERPHMCSECDYRATRLSHLTRHIQSKHSGVKPFLCPHCDYRAGRMEHLHRHVLARHPDSQQGTHFSCYGCEFTTISRDLLDHHIFSTHVEGATYGQFVDIPIKEEQFDEDSEMAGQTDLNDEDDQVS